MDISLAQAAEILTLTEDEVMFEKQEGNIQAGFNDDLAWTFNLNEVLALKASRDEKIALEAEADQED